MLEDRILYIDAEAIVLDKPAGLPVDAPRRGGESIASRLDELRCGFKRTPTPMHRLDQDKPIRMHVHRSVGKRDTH